MLVYYIDRLLYFFQWILIIYVLLSWIDSARNSVLYKRLHYALRPILQPFERMFTFGSINFGVAFVILIIQLLREVIFRILG